MANLKLSHIYKVYENGHKAVNDFSIDIADREFIVFVGPSGCGKSTTLRMIAGLETITAGDLLIGDTLVNDMEPKDRDIAMVFQSYALYPHMTVYENMAFGLRNRKMPEEEIKERVLKAAKMPVKLTNDKFEMGESELDIRELSGKNYRQLMYRVGLLENVYLKQVVASLSDIIRLQMVILKKLGSENIIEDIEKVETELKNLIN